MSQVEYLTLEDALRLIQWLSVGPVRDIGLLDSAIARPQASAFGADAYPTLDTKSAALLHSLASSHPLVDGKKRFAWLATVVFLDLNGFQPDLEDEAAFELVWGVASGESDIDKIAERLDIRPIASIR